MFEIVMPLYQGKKKKKKINFTIARTNSLLISHLTQILNRTFIKQCTCGTQILLVLQNTTDLIS